MNFLKKLFGPGDRLAPLRRAVQQGNWADALAEGEGLGGADLSETERRETENLLAAAGDALAELNLAEGEASLRAGDVARAREHFQLAAGQARHPQLQERAREYLHSSPRSLGREIAAATAAAVAAAGSCCPSGCQSSSTGAPAASPELDPMMRMELILAGYPPEIAERCLQAGERFRSAFLLAHAGEGDALSRFDQIPPGERDDLFYFERGSLQGRLGRTEQALADLEKAVALNPGHLLARETLVNLELASGREEMAEKRLCEMLAAGTNPAFCYAKLALLLARRGDLPGAIEEVQKSIQAGGDAESVQLAAILLEQAGRLGEAETCFSRLSSSGCGSSNLHLAEFWLRHGKNPDKSLEAFKGALRHEPGNPRWMLRIAQVYLGRGWKKEGMPLLEKVLAAPDLDPELRREATDLHQTFLVSSI